MKVAKDHLITIRQFVLPLDTESRRERYRNGDYPRAEHTKDIDRRYRWDLFWEAFEDIRNGDVPMDAYLDSHLDSHLDTALRSIVPPLTEPAPTPEQDEDDGLDGFLSYTVTGVSSDEGSVVVFATVEGALVAVDHRCAQALVDAISEGHEPVVAVEPWQIVGQAVAG